MCSDTSACRADPDHNRLVSRSQLTVNLLEAVALDPNITVHFSTTPASIDFEQQAVMFEAGSSDTSREACDESGAVLSQLPAALGHTQAHEAWGESSDASAHIKADAHRASAAADAVSGPSSPWPVDADAISYHSHGGRTSHNGMLSDGQHWSSDAASPARGHELSCTANHHISGVNMMVSSNTAAGLSTELAMQAARAPVATLPPEMHFDLLIGADGVGSKVCNASQMLMCLRSYILTGCLQRISVRAGSTCH
jgi:hypothetical protein